VEAQAAAPAAPEAFEVVAPEPQPVAETPAPIPVEAPAAAPEQKVEEVVEEPEQELAEGKTLEQLLASEVFRFDEDSGKGESVLRFAEDILPGARRGGKSDKPKAKKKKRRSYGDETDDA